MHSANHEIRSLQLSLYKTRSAAVTRVFDLRESDVNAAIVTG
jgi:hypothetical protein